MKKLAVLFLALFIVSCSKDDVDEVVIPEPVLDCRCDRIVQVFSFNLVSPDGTVKSSSNYITINDCTKIQRSGSTKRIIKKGDCL